MLDSTKINFSQKNYQANNIHGTVKNGMKKMMVL